MADHLHRNTHPDQGIPLSSAICCGFPGPRPLRRPAVLLPSWGLTTQPRSPKRLGHRVAAGGHGIASACARLGGSESFLRSRWAEFGACCRRPRCGGFIEPHRQRDPTPFRLDLQHLDMDDIAGLRDFAWVLDVSIGHRGDVHQSVLVDPHIDEATERSDFFAPRESEERVKCNSQSNVVVAAS